MANTCDGCGRTLGVVESMQWTVCLPCTRARHRGVLTGRCVCRQRDRRPVEVEQCRRWTSCARCLQRIA